MIVILLALLGCGEVDEPQAVPVLEVFADDCAEADNLLSWDVDAAAMLSVLDCAPSDDQGDGAMRCVPIWTFATEIVIGADDLGEGQQRLTVTCPYAGHTIRVHVLSPG